MENLTNEEKDYYELLVDLLDNGEISDSERNILNKRKEKIFNIRQSSKRDWRVRKTRATSKFKTSKRFGNELLWTNIRFYGKWHCIRKQQKNIK